MNINDMCATSHTTSKEKGWWDEQLKRTHAVHEVTESERTMSVGVLTPDEIIVKLALITTEIAEAIEEVRAGRNDTWQLVGSVKPEGLPIELADVAIRLGDLCGALNIDLEEAIARKTEYNATRSMRHGGKKA